MTYRQLDPATRARRVAALLEERRALSVHLRRLRRVVWSRWAWVSIKWWVGIAGAMCCCVTLLLCTTHSGCPEDPRLHAMTISGAAQIYIADNPDGDCPTMDDLLDGYINASTRTADAWDNDLVIECEGNDIRVTSAGPDGRLGTEDDISTGER